MVRDISYAVGYESEWDTFFHQLEPAASITMILGSAQFYFPPISYG